MRGSKPGERRGGRQKGTPNKATRDLKELAREYTAEALTTLEEVMKASESDAARVAAAKELLDRGYGKAAQTVNATVETTKYVIEVPAVAPTAEDWLANKSTAH